MTNKTNTRSGQHLDAFKRHFAAELSYDLEICPKCCSDYITPGTTGARFGICQKCYLKARTAAYDAAAREIEARMDYDRARKRLSRARQKEMRDLEEC